MQEYKDGDLTAIAIGTGPSFYEWIKTPMIEYRRSEPSGQDIIFQPKLYGCGIVPLYVNNLFAYGYGDVTHVDHIPDPNAPFHPGCLNYSGTRNLQDKPGLLPYTDLDLPHGNSSGGMALSMACLHHDVVGIIGFDGYPSGFLSYQANQDFVNDFRYLINYWQNRGRRIISLMPKSVFNPIIEPALPSQVCLPPR